MAVHVDTFEFIFCTKHQQTHWSSNHSYIKRLEKELSEIEQEVKNLESIRQTKIKATQISTDDNSSLLTKKTALLICIRFQFDQENYI